MFRANDGRKPKSNSNTNAVMTWNIFQIPTVSADILCSMNGSNSTPDPTVVMIAA